MQHGRGLGASYNTSSEGGEGGGAPRLSVPRRTHCRRANFSMITCHGITSADLHLALHHVAC